MRRLDSLIPEASSDDIFGQHAVAAMKRCMKVGYKTWLAEELNHPSWDDPDWCRMIVARSAGDVPRFAEDESVTFRCSQCRDTGFVHLDPLRRFGSSYQVSRECQPCAWRFYAKNEWTRKQEREGVRGRGRGRLDETSG